MNRLIPCTLLMLFTLVGCDAGDAPTEPGSAGSASSETASDAPSDVVAALRTEITELYAREEHDAPSVEVQHLLVSFKGAPRMRGVTRTQAEAEQLAAELMARVHAGEDFDALVKEYTNDSHPGIYPMTTKSRSGMVAGFGDVAWRLEVDQFGVAPFHKQDSPFGWHIIQRRK